MRGVILAGLLFAVACGCGSDAPAPPPVVVRNQDGPAAPPVEVSAVDPQAAVNLLEKIATVAKDATGAVESVTCYRNKQFT
ncbi:MAG: hypothetical protein VB859_18865, partial [Planctomycetaceae bacterium]